MTTAEDVSVESLMAQVADEFLDRLARGDAPTIEEYTQRYPRIANFIRQMFPTLAAMRAPDQDALPSSTEDGAPGQLGDFRIVRQVGRGGMGVVYEAEQISLSRRVALKVLPFAAALDQRQLQRFKTEAQAAGQLHHTNIVPVYGIGTDRGVHFYAMQFIDGHTVAEVIAELRTTKPAPIEGDTTPPQGLLSTVRSGRKADYYPWVARCGVQAAEALEYAHANGVIHRDIKPANLIIDPDGQVWVTDFGLAHVRSDVRLTMTGDVVGTLRYMSPEQATLRPGPVDHRCDVYSLGVTLYEMLTLGPAYPGETREQLLRQISEREPPSVRLVDRNVPEELDVIVRKAMAKDPDERYRTARDLADDLRRFLDNRPILAKRPSAWQHAKKWAKRHRQIVTTAIVGLILALAGTTCVLFFKNSQVETANDKLVKALDHARAEQERADREADQARQAKDRADGNFGHLLQTFDRRRQVFHQLSTEVSEGVQLRRVHVRDTIEALNELRAELRDERDIRYLLAVAYSDDADTSLGFMDFAAANASLDKAEALFRQLLVEAPDDAEYRSGYGSTLAIRAISLVRQDRGAEADLVYEQAFQELRSAGRAKNPSPAARFRLCEAILGVYALESNRLPVFRCESLDDAQPIVEELANEFPHNEMYQWAAISIVAERARLLYQSRQYPESLTMMRPLVERIADIHQRLNVNPKYLNVESNVMAVLARTQERVGDPDAESNYRAALRIMRDYLKRYPAGLAARYRAGEIAHRLGVYLSKNPKRLDDAVVAMRDAKVEIEAVYRLEPKNSRHAQAIVAWQIDLGDLLLRRKSIGEASDLATYLNSFRAPDVDLAIRQARFALRVAARFGNTPAEQAFVRIHHRQALIALGVASNRGLRDWSRLRNDAVFAEIIATDEFKQLTQSTRRVKDD